MVHSYGFTDRPDCSDIDLLGISQADDTAEEGSDHDKNAAAEP